MQLPTASRTSKHTSSEAPRASLCMVSFHTSQAYGLLGVRSPAPKTIHPPVNLWFSGAWIRNNQLPKFCTIVENLGNLFSSYSYDTGDTGCRKMVSVVRILQLQTQKTPHLLSREFENLTYSYLVYLIIKVP